MVKWLNLAIGSVIGGYARFRDGETIWAFLNVFGSFILGFLMFRLGILLEELI